MRAIAKHYPVAEDLLALSAEELGAVLLDLVKDDLQRSVPNMGLFHPGNLTNHLHHLDVGTSESLYPPQFMGEVGLAVAEAWNWLEQQSLIIAAPDPNGRNGFKQLSRAGRDFDSKGKAPQPGLSALLPLSALHPEIATRARPLFQKGHFDMAVLQALKQVEIALREVTGEPGSTPAVQVARMAFHTENGILTDLNADRSEREALAHLYAGALGSEKNPQSHRNADIADPADAAALIMFASYLLKTIHRRWVR